MNYYWLNKKENKNLIVFFNGWACDENICRRMNAGEFDILMFFDYTVLEMEQLNEIKKYSQVTIVAWSFGIWVANYFANMFQSNTRRIALNGSQHPIHETEGIHPEIFALTRNGYNEKSRDKFFARIFGHQKEMDLYKLCLPNRSTENQIKELHELEKHFAKNTNSNCNWNKVYIAKNDKIFPALNLQNHWKNNYILVNEPHYPFIGKTNWEQIIN